MTDLLAEAVTRAVTAELRGRYAERPRLTVPWRRVRGRAVGLPNRGDVRSLHALHSRSASRRLVVLGEPGAGKTTAAHDYAVQALAGRAAGAPVPIVLRAAEWNSGVRRLEDWIADRVAAAHPELRHHRVGRVGAARALVDAGLVIPVLDGLDEAPEDSRARLLTLINGFGFPLVVTSRSDEFAGALRGGRLDAEIVELVPLPADAVRGYLEALLNPRSRRWQAVRDEVTRDPDGQVARLLRSPLGVDLVLTSYFADEADTPPADDESVQPDLVDVLTDAVLDGTVRSTGRGTVRLLGRLAHHLVRTGVEDIAWWRLHLAVPTRALHVAALATGLVGGTGAGLLVGGRGGPLAAVGVGLLVTIGLMFVPWASSDSVDRPVRRARVSWLRLGLLQVAVLAAVLPSATPAWVGAVGVVNLAVFCVLGLRAGEASGGPLVSVRRDRAIALGRAALSGSTALSVLVRSGASPGDSAVWSVVGAVAVVGLGTTAYYRYTLARLVLWVEKVSPWNPLAFLDSAREVGLLRVVGDTYRFRHAVVRDRLATRHSREAVPRGQSAERILALREALLDAAFERADVAAAVASSTVPRLRGEVGVLFEGAIESMAVATAGARERFDASKERYARRVKVSPLWADTLQLKGIGATLLATAVWSYVLVRGALPVPGVLLVTMSAVVVLVVAVGFDIARDTREDGRNKTDGPSGPRARFVSVSGRFLRRHDRLRRGSRAVGVHGIGGGLLSVVAADLIPPDDFGVIPMTAAASGLALVMVWRLTGRLRDRAIALGYDDPARWPAQRDVPRAAAARDDAQRAYAEWFQALVEHGVLPLVASRVETLVQRSYSVTLPAASVEKLGDITESTQFVPTETSAGLARMLTTMTSGAIGVSGVRGVGKSTLLRMFGDRRFGAARDDLTLVVHAPTDYDSRDFLVHLFTRVCESVLPRGQAALVVRTSTARRGLVVLSVMAVGGLLAVAGFRWPMVVDLSAWVRRNTGDVVGWSGVAFMVLAPGWWLRSRVRRRRHDRPRDGTAEDIARGHLTALRYVETTTRTRTTSVKPPFGVDLGGSRSRQHATLARTHPELVGEFREFLDFLSLRQRSRAGARIVVCIDELDKIGSAEETERFINDIKSVFGVEGCFFLVAVSEDALASFAQRAFTVRTTFDSAFDAVIRVDRFTLADTRRLLVHRVLRLPEPFVWLCHALSGGLPRDLNRTVRQMYDLRAARQVHALPDIAAGLIGQDLLTAVDAQVLRLRGRVDPPAVDLQRWVARAAGVPLSSKALTSHREASPDGRFEGDEPALVREQFNAYLYYAATLVRAFHEDVDLTIEQLEGADDKSDVMGELAHARARLSVDPALSVAHVEAFRAAVPLLGWDT